MRYIDTGTRNPEHALGAWLSKHAIDDTSVRELRWQSGFFDANCLGFFAPLMARLQTLDGALNILVGSNDGMTRRADVEALLSAAGPRRGNQQIGVVYFSNGYFHPKTVHIVRDDGSAAAYVGSANLTQNGVTSLHVEAGLLLDTREEDDSDVLTNIADAIDWWFEESRPPVSLVYEPADLQGLVEQGILDVPPPPSPQRGRQTLLQNLLAQATRLRPLLSVPARAPQAVATPPSAPSAPVAAASAPVTRSNVSVASEKWGKPLTRSDAQRKRTGNQRGSITLVQAGHFIDAQTYFRDELFKNASWQRERTRTGERRETAVVPFKVDFLGRDLGVLRLKVTYASNREAAQANYTSLLHLGGLTSYFAARDVTGKYLELNRLSNGQYTLSITDQAP